MFGKHRKAQKNDRSCVFWEDRVRNVCSHSMFDTVSSIKSMKDFSNSMLSLVVQYASEHCYQCNESMHDFSVHDTSLLETLSSVSAMKNLPSPLLSLIAEFASEECEDCGHIISDFEIAKKKRNIEWTQIGTDFVCSECCENNEQDRGDWWVETCLCVDCNREDLDSFHDDELLCQRCETEHACRECYDANAEKSLTIHPPWFDVICEMSILDLGGSCSSCVDIDDAHITRYATRSNRIIKVGNTDYANTKCMHEDCPCANK